MKINVFGKVSLYLLKPNLFCFAIHSREFIIIRILEFTLNVTVLDKTARIY